MTWYQHHELKMYNYITAYTPKNPRQELFEQIKYSDQPGLQRYQGRWGREILHWDINQERGLVYCTPSRHQEIVKWVDLTVNECAPGND